VNKNILLKLEKERDRERPFFIQNIERRVCDVIIRAETQSDPLAPEERGPRRSPHSTARRESLVVWM